MKKLLLLLFIVPFFGAREIPQKPIPQKPAIQFDMLKINSLNRSVQKLEISATKLNAVIR